MSILIEGATIVSMDPEHGSEPFQGNILIEGERIAAIGETGADVEADRVIPGAGKLVIPGLINGHIHTPEAFAKGRYDNMAARALDDARLRHPRRGRAHAPHDLPALRALRHGRD